MTTTLAKKQTITTRLTSKAVHDEITKASFAVISYVTPAGEPRSIGVMYQTIGSRLYIATDVDSWKARHIDASGRVSVTVPVRRGGVMSLLTPIPPATISFSGRATVYPPWSPQVRPLLGKLRKILPEGAADTVAVIEVVPTGTFVTYGIGVSLLQMRDTTAARARVPVQP